MLNVDLSMLLTALYVVTVGLFLVRLRNVEKRATEHEKELAKLRAVAEERSQTESERILKEVRLEVQRAIEESRNEVDVESSGHTLLTEMTQDDQKRIIVRFIENL
jgi:F0F1-type ATP synthase membrane subunit b/b'